MGEGGGGIQLTCFKRAAIVKETLQIKTNTHSLGPDQPHILFGHDIYSQAQEEVAGSTWDRGTN